jgi:oxygen-independent coproporphyrinogen III oxidase
MIRHLYVHIPFCPKVCPYCSFYKEASDRHKTQGFLDAVLTELDAAALRYELQPETIFFGGGTPTALSTSQLTYLLGGLRDRLDLSHLQEWTLEMNPATVSLEKASRMHELGVNRVSMGVQAWDEATLQKLGRVHTGEQAERSYAILREAGFENINLDLIFGTPGQAQETWFANLERTIELRPEHISAYCLTYEEDTEFFHRFQAGELVQDNNADAELYEGSIEILEVAGYLQYETSNYAQPGFECRHNQAYWLGNNYLGLGPSAFSTVAEDRWKNIPDTSAYTQLIESCGEAKSFYEKVTPQIRESEQIAFGLRTNRGVALEQLVNLAPQIERLAADGFLTQSQDRIFLTKQGRLVADSVAELLI